MVINGEWWLLIQLNSIRGAFRSELGLILVLTLYLFLAGFLFSHFQYIINSDGISYICIARNYLNGHINHAINGYWGPLFSWLLIPFLLKGYTPVSALISAKILSIVIGLFTIIGLWFLSFKFEMDDQIRFIFVFSLIPVMLLIIFSLVTSDLLMACILIYYFNYIFNKKYLNNISYGFICGFVGALAYLSKIYAFPFFLTHFIFFNAIYYFKTSKLNRKIIKKNLVIGLTVFFIISAFWALAISEKYDDLTIGTSSKYNYEVAGPNVQFSHPMNIYGVMKPPNSNAVSSWEDPSYAELDSWSPLESWASFKYQLKLIGSNTERTAYILYYFSPISFIIILLSIITFFKSDNREYRMGIIGILITIFLFIIGYLPVFVETRYLWLVYFLILFLAAYILTDINKEFKINHSLKIFTSILIFLLLIASPLNTLITMSYSTNVDYELSELLKNNYNVHGNIASNSESGLCLSVVYYLNSSYYGSVSINENELGDSLKRYGIDYYLVWNTRENIVLKDYVDITKSNYTYPRVFKRL